jgi:creatinine amidohydrolase
MTKTIEMINLTKTQIDKLDRKNTVFVNVVSPIEVHGPHLPLGSDLMAAKEYMKRTCNLITNFTIIHIEDLPIGAHVLPSGGSMPVHYRTIKKIVIGWGTKLKDMGFKHWIIFNGHGGADHMLALKEASIQLRKKGFNLVVPFLNIFNEMQKHHTNLNLPIGSDGDINDFHAGTNETSVMLAINKSKVSNEYKSLKKYFPKRKSGLGNFLRLFRENDMATVSDWTNDPESKYYIGNPSIANIKDGELMINYHVKRSIEIFKHSIQNGYIPPKLFSPFLTLLLKIVPEW